MIWRWLAMGLTIIIWIYALAAVASMGFAVSGAVGMFGAEPDRIAAIFAILFALPWVMMVDTTTSAHPLLWGTVMLIVGTALNIAILAGLRWCLRRAGGSGR